MLSRRVSLGAYDEVESGPENGTLTGINTRPGCPPYPSQLNDPEDEDRDGLRNVGPYKTEPPYPADSPKEYHKHQDLFAGKASNCIKSYAIN
jgi:hypothetical protein